MKGSSQDAPAPLPPKILPRLSLIEEKAPRSAHVLASSRGKALPRIGIREEPVKIEIDLMKLFKKEEWGILSHWLIWHGRRRCSARKPDCANCELRQLCPSATIL